MDHIDKVLATASDSPSQFGPSIRAALAIGKNAMNRYYNKTDHSEVYRIAMGMSLCDDYPKYTNTQSPPVLHPRHKLEYFRIHKWEEEWIQAARDIVEDEFSRSYELDEGTDDEDDEGHDSNETVGVINMLFLFFGLTVLLADFLEYEEHLR